MRKYGYFVVLSVLALFLTMSCNIGLGEAVDTQEPKIDISYPPISAVVRDDFVLGGNWSDDGSISSINITVQRADTKETKFTTIAQISAEEKTWKAEIPVENLLDGTPLRHIGMDKMRRQISYARICRGVRIWRLPAKIICKMGQS